MKTTACIPRQIVRSGLHSRNFTTALILLSIINFSRERSPRLILKRVVIITILLRTLPVKITSINSTTKPYTFYVLTTQHSTRCRQQSDPLFHLFPLLIRLVCRVWSRFKFLLSQVVKKCQVFFTDFYLEIT